MIYSMFAMYCDCTLGPCHEYLCFAFCFFFFLNSAFMIKFDETYQVSNNKKKKPVSFVFRL